MVIVVSVIGGDMPKKRLATIGVRFIIAVFVNAALLAVSSAQSGSTPIVPVLDDGTPMIWTDFAASALYKDTDTRNAELKALRIYHDNGKYDSDMRDIEKIGEAWILARSSKVTKPALVLDIDETTLTNFAEMSVDDFEYQMDGKCPLEGDLPAPRERNEKPDVSGHIVVPCGVISWDRSAKAPAIGATKKLFNFANARGVAVFFVTGREEFERSWTAKNLDSAGFRKRAGLFMRPTGKVGFETGKVDPSAASFKTSMRLAIENMGYHIILNVGDQLSDLSGGHADQALKYPNPFYRLQ